MKYFLSLVVLIWTTTIYAQNFIGYRSETKVFVFDMKRDSVVWSDTYKELYVHKSDLILINKITRAANGEFQTNILLLSGANSILRIDTIKYKSANYPEFINCVRSEDGVLAILGRENKTSTFIKIHFNGYSEEIETPLYNWTYIIQNTLLDLPKFAMLHQFDFRKKSFNYSLLTHVRKNVNYEYGTILEGVYSKSVAGLKFETLFMYREHDVFFIKNYLIETSYDFLQDSDTSYLALTFNNRDSVVYVAAEHTDFNGKIDRIAENKHGEYQHGFRVFFSNNMYNNKFLYGILGIGKRRDLIFSIYLHDKITDASRKITDQLEYSDYGSLYIF